MTAVAFHVCVGLVCVVTGAVAMLSKKRPGRHPTFGMLYYWFLAAVFASATAFSMVRWAEDPHLFVLGALAFAAASVGRSARRQRWREWIKIDIAAMAGSYILLLTAFYVDNGPSLPLWRELPWWALWVVPSAVGIPIVVHTLLRHPLARRAADLPDGAGDRVTSRLRLRKMTVGAARAQVGLAPMFDCRTRSHPGSAERHAMRDGFASCIAVRAPQRLRWKFARRR